MRYVVRHRNHPELRHHPSARSATARDWIVYDSEAHRFVTSTVTLHAAEHIAAQLENDRTTDSSDDERAVSSERPGDARRIIAERFQFAGKIATKAAAEINALRKDVIEDLLRVEDLEAENRTLRERLEKIESSARVYDKLVRKQFENLGMGYPSAVVSTIGRAREELMDAILDDDR